MLIVALLLSYGAGSASAQANPPRVELERLIKEKTHSLPVGAVGVGNCFSPVTLREMKEVAVLTVTVNGPWERSAEHLAKQKAAEAGANCMQPLASYGPEEDHYPIVRQYRAYLVTTSVTTIDGTFRFPASPRSFEPMIQQMPSLAAPFPVAAPAPSTAAVAEMGELLIAPPPEETDTLWISGRHIFSHQIELDLRNITPRRWENIRNDVKKFFPASEFEVLNKAKLDGRPVSIDLRKKTIELLGADF